MVRYTFKIIYVLVLLFLLMRIVAIETNYAYYTLATLISEGELSSWNYDLNIMSLCLLAYGFIGWIVVSMVMGYYTLSATGTCMTKIKASLRAGEKEREGENE
jgi:hypothetical protein